MRLWHEDLISHLPAGQLMGQHRECCALRGKGWGRRHSTVDYVFRHTPMKLYAYHMLIIDEMHKRGYKPDVLWEDPCYRGKLADAYEEAVPGNYSHPIYAEHDDAYMEECLANLRAKGIEISLSLLEKNRKRACF